jgi:DNA polymerase III epsilon subunit-like protein
MQEVVFLDTETSGLVPAVAEILEIAIVALDGTVLLDTRVRPVRLDATRAADPEGTQKALEINGYATQEHLWDGAPTIAEIADRVVAVLEHKVIVGQNPKFDRDFVVDGLSRAGVDEAYKKVRPYVIDTATLAWEHLVPCGLDNLNLSAECEFLGISLDRTHRHGALNDALAARQVYLMTLRATEEQRFAWRMQAQQRALAASTPA